MAWFLRTDATLRRVHTGRRAFTLVELLAAMAVFALIMLMLGSILSGSMRTWSTGERNVQNNTTARAVLDLLSRDISQAVADGRLTMEVFTNSYNQTTKNWQGSGQIYGLYPHKFCFASMSGDLPSTNSTQVSRRKNSNSPVPNAVARELQLVKYFIAVAGTGTALTNKLMRWTSQDPNQVTDAYVLPSTGTWTTDLAGDPTHIYGGGQTNEVARNITTFEVYKLANYTKYELPPYVDVVIGFLSDQDAVRVRLLPSAQQTAFVVAHEQRFTTRVAVPNSMGYLISQKNRLFDR